MSNEEKAMEIAADCVVNGKILTYDESAKNGALKAMQWKDEQYLKNATDIIINRSFLADIKQYIHEKYLDYKIGEKVKLILIKENEQ